MRILQEWDEVAKRIEETAESVLTDDSPENPAPEWHERWAREKARRISQDVMMHLDGED